MNQPTKISLHQLSNPLVEALIAEADTLNLIVSTHETGATIVDAGIKATGSVEAGRQIAAICMGGLGDIALVQDLPFSQWQSGVQVSTQAPVLACLASQYAGWALQHEKFFSLGSGPARCIAQREDLFKELNYQDSAEKTVLILESDTVPPAEVIQKVARDTGIAAKNLTFILTPTRSLAGSTQIVARVVEVALHKAHTLHFPLENIVSGTGTAPLPPISRDFITAMGRTNDAILFGGNVTLTVTGDDKAAEKLANDLPSSASKDYGKPFAEVFKAVNMDFYKIDPMLFSPAKVAVVNQSTGHQFEAGKLDEALLNLSFND